MFIHPAVIIVCLALMLGLFAGMLVERWVSAGWKRLAMKAGKLCEDQRVLIEKLTKG